MNKEEIEKIEEENKVQAEKDEAMSLGYTGEMCETCGSMRVKRNGSCTVCEDCGSTSGCS